MLKSSDNVELDLGLTDEGEDIGKDWTVEDERGAEEVLPVVGGVKVVEATGVVSGDVGGDVGGSVGDTVEVGCVGVGLVGGSVTVVDL